MTQYEYKVVPAPRKGLKGKGIKRPEARFAYAIQSLMNTEAAAGWEFVRAETLPSDERHGLTSAQTVYRDLLVFRRATAADSTAAEGPVNVVPLEQDSATDPADPPAENLPDDPVEHSDHEDAPDDFAAEDQADDTHAPVAGFETTRRG